MENVDPPAYAEKENQESLSEKAQLKQNVESAMLIISGDDNSSQSAKTTSLQDSFRRFRDQKIKERQIMKMSRLNQEGQRSQEFKDNLRQKFVETAKKYLGVPYGIRYKSPEDPVAPLYLDCCALVRKVVQDLQEEFGFIIGRWNQAYQMDTLPIVINDPCEMKPGDLVFYEGTFISKRAKEQKHNNVHVEIFLGGETGEATIGSRYHRGKISIFPSYKFHSNTWRLIRHHFRSIDTWLDGVCVSHCSEHAWQSDEHYLAVAAAAGKRSIFNGGDEEKEEGAEERRGNDMYCEDDDDVSAGGEESPSEGEEGLRETEKEVEDGQADSPLPHNFPPAAAAAAAGESNAEKADASGGMKRPKRISSFQSSPVSPAGAVAGEEGIRHDALSRSASSCAEPNHKPYSNRTTSPSVASLCPPDAAHAAATAVTTNPRGGGAGRRRGKTATAKSVDANLALTVSAASVNPTATTSPERTCALKSRRNSYGAGSPGAPPSAASLVGSTPSASLVAKSTTAVSTRRKRSSSIDGAVPAGIVAPLTDSSQESSPSAISVAGSSAGRKTSTLMNPTASSPNPYTYFVSKSNGWRLVKAALDRRGWQQLPFEYQFSTRYGLKWVERRSQIDYRAHTPGQLVCHIPNNDCITTKVGLLYALRDLYSRSQLKHQLKHHDNELQQKLKDGQATAQGSPPPRPPAASARPPFASSTVMAAGATAAGAVLDSADCCGSNGGATGGIPIGVSGDGLAGDVSGVSAALPHTLPWLPATYDLEAPADCMALLAAEEQIALLAPPSQQPQQPSEHTLPLSTDPDCSYPPPTFLSAAVARSGSPTRALNTRKSPTKSPSPPHRKRTSSPTSPAAAAQKSPQKSGVSVGVPISVNKSSAKTAKPPQSGGIWIYKPSSNNRGRGIRVVRGLAQLRELCSGTLGTSGVSAVANHAIAESSGDSKHGGVMEFSGAVPPSSGIVQRYIENPLLVSRMGKMIIQPPLEGFTLSVAEERFKFDIRCYLLIARNYPPGCTLAYYHPGYCRLSMKAFTLNPDQMDDACVHLTNASIQKKDKGYQAVKESQIQSIAAVADNLEQCGKLDSAEYVRSGLDHDIKRCLLDVIKAGNKKLMKQHGYFDLLGCDFMLSDDNKLSLLEANTNPALSLDNSVLEQLLPGVVDNAIELVLTAQGPRRRDFLMHAAPTASSSSSMSSNSSSSGSSNVGGGNSGGGGCGAVRSNAAAVAEGMPDKAKISLTEKKKKASAENTASTAPPASSSNSNSNSNSNSSTDVAASGVTEAAGTAETQPTYATQGSSGGDATTTAANNNNTSNRQNAQKKAFGGNKSVDFGSMSARVKDADEDYPVLRCGTLAYPAKSFGNHGNGSPVKRDSRTDAASAGGVSGGLGGADSTAPQMGFQLIFDEARGFEYH